MARLVYFLVADHARVDPATHSLDIINVLEERTFAAFPAATDVTAVCMMEAEAGDVDKDLQLTLRITLPDGSSLRDIPHRLRFRDGEKRRTKHWGIRQAVIPVPGEAIFELLLDGQRVARYGVTVLLTPRRQVPPR
jgi:hypothetical protein